MTQHASDCATNNGPALPAGECDCEFSENVIQAKQQLALLQLQHSEAQRKARDARVERLARRLCEQAGYDPDSMGTLSSPFIVSTPAGQAHTLFANAVPIWRFWMSTAAAAIELLADA